MQIKDLLLFPKTLMGRDDRNVLIQKSANMFLSPQTLIVIFKLFLLLNIAHILATMTFPNLIPQRCILVISSIQKWKTVTKTIEVRPLQASVMWRRSHGNTISIMINADIAVGTAPVHQCFERHTQNVLQQIINGHHVQPEWRHTKWGDGGNERC